MDHLRIIDNNHIFTYDELETIRETFYNIKPNIQDQINHIDYYELLVIEEMERLLDHGVEDYEDLTDSDEDEEITEIKITIIMFNEIIKAHMKILCNQLILIMKA